MSGIGPNPDIQKISLNFRYVLIVLKNSVSGRSDKFLASMANFVLTDMRGQKK